MRNKLAVKHAAIAGLGLDIVAASRDIAIVRLHTALPLALGQVYQKN